MTIYKDFDLNDYKTEKPWGPRESQAWKDAIDTLVMDCIVQTKQTGGHKHAKMYSPSAVVGVEVLGGGVVQLAVLNTEGVVLNNASGNLSTIAKLPITKGGTNSGVALSNDLVMISSGGTIIESVITVSELGLLDGMVGLSTGTSNNDKFVTQGYVDDNMFPSIVPIDRGGTNNNTALNNSRVMISAGGKIVESSQVTVDELNLLNGIVSVSTGTSDNDKLVTQGYVDDIGFGIVPISRGGTNSGTGLSDDLVMISESGAIVEGAVSITELGLLSGKTSTDIDNWDAGYSHSQIAGGDSVHVSTTENTEWDTAYSHSQSAHAPSGAEVNVNADWNSSSGDSEILNKPTFTDNFLGLTDTPGSFVIDQIFFQSGSAVTSSADFKWDDSGKVLYINGAAGVGKAPDTGIDFHVYNGIADAVIEIESLSNNANLVLNAVDTSREANILFNKGASTYWTMGKKGTAEAEFLIKDNNSFEYILLNSSNMVLLGNTSGAVGIGGGPSGIYKLEVIRDVGGAHDVAFVNNHHEDGNGTVGIRFLLGYTASAIDDAALITTGKYQAWDSTASTRDSFLDFFTSEDGVLGTVAMRITSNNIIGISTATPLQNVGTSGGDFSGQGVHIKALGTDIDAKLIIEGQNPGLGWGYSASIIFADTEGSANEKMFVMAWETHSFDFYTINDNTTLKDSYFRCFEGTPKMFQVNHGADSIDFVAVSNNGQWGLHLDADADSGAGNLFSQLASMKTGEAEHSVLDNIVRVDVSTGEVYAVAPS